MTPPAPTPAPRSALPEITAWSVSPAPCVPTASILSPCFLKMPASCPSVGAWFSQLLIWPIAILRVSSACAACAPKASGSTKPSAAVKILNLSIRNPPVRLLCLRRQRIATAIQHGGLAAGKPLARAVSRRGAFAAASARRQSRPLQPRQPILPSAVEPGRLAGDLPGMFGLPRRERGDLADVHRVHLEFGILG